MTDAIKKIRFQGEEYLLIGETDGAIAKQEDYRHGRCSYAHLFPNGEVMRFKKQIGTIGDIEFLGDAEATEFADDALYNTLYSYWGP